MAHSSKSAPAPTPPHTQSANTVRVSNVLTSLLFFILPVYQVGACHYKLPGEGHWVKSMSLFFFQIFLLWEELHVVHMQCMYDPVQYTVLGIKEHIILLCW